MKTILLSAAIFIACTSMAQLADFEDMVIPAEDALYGQDQVTDGDTIYTTDIYTFENNWNATWFSFAGWAFSNVSAAGWAAT